MHSSRRTTFNVVHPSSPNQAKIQRTPLVLIHSSQYPGYPSHVHIGTLRLRLDRVLFLTSRCVLARSCCIFTHTHVPFTFFSTPGLSVYTIPSLWILCGVQFSSRMTRAKCLNPLTVIHPPDSSFRRDFPPEPCVRLGPPPLPCPPAFPLSRSRRCLRLRFCVCV